MKEIPLTGGLITIVDDEDFEMLSHWKWSANENGYAYRRTPVRRKQQMVRMHRLIMLPDPDEQVDHINGDGLDNRRCNLRLCTLGQNRCNLSKYRNNASGRKGVWWSQGRWCAAIRKGGRAYHLGRFLDRDAAARAYDSAALELHGEFARLNFPEAAS